MREGHEGHEEREKENVSVVRLGLAELRLRPCYLKEERPPCPVAREGQSTGISVDCYIGNILISRLFLQY